MFLSAHIGYQDQPFKLYTILEPMSWNSSVSAAKECIEGNQFLKHLNNRGHMALDLSEDIIVSAPPCQIYNGTLYKLFSGQECMRYPTFKQGTKNQF